MDQEQGNDKKIMGSGLGHTGMIRRVLLLAVLAGLAHVIWGAFIPPGFSSEERVVDVPLHCGVRRVADLLQKHGIIHSAFYFRLLCSVTHTQSKLRAGEYAFPRRSGLLDVWEAIRDGKVKVHYVTIPEGYSSLQIAQALEQEGLATQADFLKVTSDPAFCQKNHVPAKTAEGFLFPDSYEFIKGMTPAEMAGQMVQRFFKIMAPGEIRQAGSRGLNLRQWVTLASIVEKEAEAKAERPVIAGVFLNRLQKKMRLESCPTVLFALGKTKPRLSLDDLNVVSPYNTYRHRGLPPGPICSPGRESLLAVLTPSGTDFLFFVAKGDGTHAFSRTLEEHVKAKRKYR